jgi:inward rectifier potassium channel
MELLQERKIESGQDLGIGDILSGQKRQRLLNRDGTFNVLRNRKSLIDDFSYSTFLRVSWPVFMVSVVLLFILVNLLFATTYVLCGHESLAVAGPDPGVSHFWRAYFFSVHTFATIGYGNVVPVGMLSNFVVVVESFFGLLGYSLVTGLLFARFARPRARIRFAKRGAMRTNDEPALLLRMTNDSRSELIELEASLVASFFDPKKPILRQYFPLPLERHHVSFLPLAWTVVHRITAESPLYGMTPEEFHERSGEVMLQVSGTDQVSAQVVYTRISYNFDDIDWGTKYVDMYIHDKHNGLLGIDMDRFDSTQPL